MTSVNSWLSDTLVYILSLISNIGILYSLIRIYFLIAEKVSEHKSADSGRRYNNVFTLFYKQCGATITVKGILWPVTVPLFLAKTCLNTTRTHFRLEAKSRKTLRKIRLMNFSAMLTNIFVANNEVSPHNQKPTRRGRPSKIGPVCIFCLDVVTPQVFTRSLPPSNAHPTCKKAFNTERYRMWNEKMERWYNSRNSRLPQDSLQPSPQDSTPEEWAKRVKEEARRRPPRNVLTG